MYSTHVMWVAAIQVSYEAYFIVTDTKELNIESLTILYVQLYIYTSITTMIYVLSMHVYCNICLSLLVCHHPLTFECMCRIYVSSVRFDVVRFSCNCGRSPCTSLHCAALHSSSCSSSFHVSFNYICTSTTYIYYLFT